MTPSDLPIRLAAGDGFGRLADAVDVPREFWPESLWISLGILAAAVAICLPALVHARIAGRDDQAADTPPNLVPLVDGPIARVDDRLRNAVVQFDLPRDLRPEQIAVLRYDGDPDRAIAAALFDLQAKGVVTLDHVTGRTRVVEGAARTGLSEFQSRLLRALGGDMGKPLENRDWALSALYQDAMAQGWFRQRPDYASYGARLWSAFGFGVGAILALYAGNMLLEGYWTYAMPMFAGVIFLWLIGFTFGYAERRRPIRTPKARALAIQLAGFGRVLGATEQGWLRLHPDEPYPPSWAAAAIALGVSDLRPRDYARHVRGS